LNAVTFYIEKIKVELIEATQGLRLTALDLELPLPGQSIEETKETVGKNFETVKEKYQPAASAIMTTEELDEICLRVTLHYFYLYNSWRSVSEKEKNRSLAFQEKDFSHPNTRDKVIQFFRLKYPNDYAAKSAALLGMKTDELLKYETDNRDFYNAFR